MGLMKKRFVDSAQKVPAVDITLLYAHALSLPFLNDVVVTED